MNKRIKGTRVVFNMFLVIILLASNLITIVHAEEFETAAQAVEAMGNGWNLGNALDSCDYKVYDAEEISLKKGNYQMMASYQTKVYSGWDASSVSNFSSSSNKCTLTWKISKLNSSLSKKSGKFSLQLMNYSIGKTGNNKLKYKITKAQFVTAKGKVIKLSNMLGTYVTKIKDGKATLVNGDLTKQSSLAKASSLVGGTLTIKVSIVNYPKPTNWVTNEVYYETLWGNPVTTNAMIKKVKAAGFNAIRVPVTYYDHMDKNGKIDKDWMKRVKQVVDYAMANNLYCIINLHHDTGTTSWLKADQTNYDATAKKLAYVWQQIATTFKSYGKQLLFEGFNEILNKSNQWTGAGAEAYEVTNALNQVFVDTVRKTGGNNATRNLIVSTYAASVGEEILKAFVLPEDSVENHLIAEVHCYAPLVFSWNQDSVNWTKTRSTWDAEADAKEIAIIFDRLNTYLVSKGIPVIVGEFGAWNKNNTSEREKLINCYLDNARKYDISCFWWDAGGKAEVASAVTGGSLLNRKKNIWYFQELVDCLAGK